MNAVSTTRVFAAAAAFAMTAVLLAGPAYAQSEPVSRTAVINEMRAARQAGQMMPAGEGTPTDSYGSLHSAKTRAERKAETMEARRNGAFQPGGLGLYKSHMSQQTAMAHSTKTRAERKAETQQAAKEHKLMRAGEAG